MNELRCKENINMIKYEYRDELVSFMMNIRELHKEKNEMKKLKKVLTLACIGTSLLLNTSGVFAANVNTNLNAKSVLQGRAYVPQSSVGTRSWGVLSGSSTYRKTVARKYDSINTTLGGAAPVSGFYFQIVLKPSGTPVNAQESRIVYNRAGYGEEIDLSHWKNPATNSYDSFINTPVTIYASHVAENHSTGEGYVVYTSTGD